jgi:hypothetical protein
VGGHPNKRAQRSWEKTNTMKRNTMKRNLMRQFHSCTETPTIMQRLLRTKLPASNGKQAKEGNHMMLRGPVFPQLRAERRRENGGLGEDPPGSPMTPPAGSSDLSTPNKDAEEPRRLLSPKQPASSGMIKMWTFQSHHYL